MDYYQNGNQVTASVVGTKTDTGEKIKISDKVLWMGEIEEEKPNILIDNAGEKVLVGFYKDSPNVDVYIDQISLETNGDTKIVTKHIETLIKIFNQNTDE